MIKPRFNWLFLTFTLFVCACGYRFPGSGSLPSGIQKIYIPLFTNRTNEVGIENVLTDDVTNEFILQRKGALTDDNHADGVLSGIVASVLTRTISQTGAGASIEREVVVRVEMRLTDKSGRLVWIDRQLFAREPYEVGDNNIESSRRRREAIETLSTRLAQKIYNRLTDDF